MKRPILFLKWCLCTFNSSNRCASFFLSSCLILLIVTLSPTATYSQGGGVDLALCVNGSGSISPADFTLQKEGIKIALADPLVFPRDSSIAFTLVQYASGVTQVHIPYTLIRNQNDINTLIAGVDNIVQIGGSTNPGDGINTAMGVLNANGDTSRTQIICLSTDGLPNSGASVPAALSAAQSSPIGLDRFSVLAIEDPPFAFAADFNSFYGPLVFGGGTVTVTVNSTEYANILGATCLFSDLELIGVEVNQSVQNWNNSVTVIENKTTYVRAHIQTKDMDPAPAVVRLKGFRNGAELSGSPLTALNTIVARPNAVARRGDLDESVNFRLPANWLNGTVELEVEGVGGSLDCMEAAGTPNDCKVEVTFESTDEPEVRFVKIKWADTSGTEYEPTDAHITELANRLRAVYPIDRLDWNTGQMNWSGAIDTNTLSTVLQDLESMRFWDFCWDAFGCDRIYYGVFRDAALGGLGYLPGTSSAGNMPAGDNSYGYNRHAHELAHNLGIGHAPFCNAGGTTDTAFPYPGGRIGPLNMGPDSANWGFDVHKMRIPNPNSQFDMMSYCGNWRWISDYNYDLVRNSINSEFKPAPAAPPAKLAVTDYLIIRGTINLTNQTASFLPFGVLPSPIFPPVPPPGDYTLCTFDDMDNQLDSIPFQPLIFQPDSPNMTQPFGSFIIPLVLNPAIDSVCVKYMGSCIGTATASNNAPSIQVTFPNGGESLSGMSTTLQWMASDPDGDPLTYLIQYSPDNGTTWQTLVVDWPTNSYDVDLNVLGQTTQGLIRVMASDGFNAVFDTSDGTFITPNNLPIINLISPNDGDTYIGIESIFFEGDAFDPDEGAIPASGLNWTSSLDGFLGSGFLFDLQATSLSEGNHVITLTATDALGASSSDSVTVTVSRLPIVGPVCDSLPDLAIQSAPSSCQGGAITVTASSNDMVTYLWSTGETTASIDVMASGVYAVTVTDMIGCENEDSIDIAYDATALINSYTLLAEKEVKLEGSVVTAGSVGATKHDGKVELKNSASVNSPGSFAKANTVKVDNSSSLLTAIQMPVDIVLPDPPDVKGGKVKLKIPENAIVTINGSFYEKIEVGENATVNFTAPEIIAKEFKIKKDAVVMFDTCTTIRLEKKLELEDRVDILQGNGYAVFYVTEDVKVKKQSKIEASIVAIDKEIKIEDSKSFDPTIMTGFYIAKKIEAKKHTFVGWNPTCYNCAPVPAQASPKASPKAPALAQQAELNDVPSVGILFKAFPNPFSNRTLVEFMSPEDRFVDVELINIRGERIAHLFEGIAKASVVHQLDIDATDLPSGMYLVIYKSAEMTYTQKLMLQK